MVSLSTDMIRQLKHISYFNVMFGTTGLPWLAETFKGESYYMYHLQYFLEASLECPAECVNGSQLAKMKMSIPDMSLP